jgi:hypothetical protein
VNKDVIQEKLTAIADATTTTTTSKAVLSNANVRSIGVDSTLNITEASNVIKLAVKTDNIQEKLSAGTLSGTSTAPILVSKKVKGLNGERGITVTGDNEQVVILQGPPVADWTSGLTAETHYIDTGPTDLTIRNTNSLPVAKFANVSRNIQAYGDLVMLPEKALQVTNVDPVENTTYVKVRGDLYIDPDKIIFVDSITPHLRVGEPLSVQVNGDLDIQGTLTTTGPTTITPGATRNVYSKDEVNSTFSALMGSAPATLDTLKELAAALADDKDYAATVENQLATKAPLLSPTFTGTTTCNSLAVSGSRLEVATSLANTRLN